MPTKFGPQPARVVLAKLGYTNAAAAETLGENPGHLYNALRGQCPPCERLRTRLVELTRSPIEDLFTEESLRHRYKWGAGAVAGRRVGQSPETRAKISAAMRRHWAKPREVVQ